MLIKLPNIKKEDLAATLLSQLRGVLPSRNPVPPYLLVDDDVYAALSNSVRQGEPPDYIMFDGWKVISRSMVCELGDTQS